MKIKSKNELLVKSFVQTVSSATTFSKRFKKVSRLLEVKPELTEEQWLRVWRGMYYSIWYSEMTKGCDILAQKIGTHEDPTFLSSGFKALTNDWFGIDVFRLDKYMFLVRIMTNTSIKLQSKLLFSITSENDSKEESIDNQKSEEKVEEIVDISEEDKQKTTESVDKCETNDSTSKQKNKKFDKRKDILKKEIEFPIDFKAKLIDNIVTTVKSSIGLTLHMTDIFIDEFVRVLADIRPKAHQRVQLYYDLLVPFVKLMAVTEDYRVLNNCKQHIFDKLKKEVLIQESIDCRKRVLQRLIDAMIAIGGIESIGRKNRDSIYAIIENYKTKVIQLNKTDENKSLKRKKIVIGRGRSKRIKYELTSSSPFVTSIVPIAVV